MPDTRFLTYAVGDGTYKPANNLFPEPLAHDSGEYLELE